MSDNSYQHAGSDAFTLRPFLFLLSLSTLLALLWVFFSGGLIEVIEGSLLLVFFAFTVIVGLSAAFRWRWRRPISIILGASAAVGAFYLAAFLAYALAPPIFHYSLSGPDWAKIPEGYSGVTPEKIVAELNVPKEYLERFNGTTSQPQSAISIAVLYPNMNSGVGAGSSQARICIIITANREDDARKGVQFLTHEEGRIRDAQSDVGSLCAFVDHQHPGYAGNEFYSSCNEAEQTFFVECFPPFKVDGRALKLPISGTSLAWSWFIGTRC